MSLEEILHSNLLDVKKYYLENLDLDIGQKAILNTFEPKVIIDPNLNGYAQLEFSWKNNYVLRFRPEAVNDLLAVAEEYGHYLRLALNAEARFRLIHAAKETQEYLEFVALEEYFARYAALMYVNHKGVKDNNKLWSQIANNRITLLTKKPDDLLSHFLGYTAAEEDYAAYGSKGLKFALKNNDVSKVRYTPIEKMPKILTPFQLYQIAA